MPELTSLRPHDTVRTRTNAQLAYRAQTALETAGIPAITALARALPLSPEDSALADEVLARHDGDPVAALRSPLPDDVAAEVRRVMAVDGAR